jgi:glycosyltransferase involved in cell wall biosynthesis
MKILMQNRRDALKHVGGDTIQMLKTKEYLEKIGVKIDISLSPNPRVDKYDIVHVFNIQEYAANYSFRQIANAKKHGKPVALSTIYWKWDDYEIEFNVNHSQNSTRGQHDLGYNGNALIRGINGILNKGLGIKVRSITLMNKEMRRKEHAIKRHMRLMYIKRTQYAALLLSDMLLPNAEGEARLIEQAFGLPLKYYSVVPNCADKSILDGDRQIAKNRFGFDDYVLCVGRVQPVKNQLNLIKAMRDTNLKLVIVGKHINRSYIELCKKFATKRVVFVEEIPHEELAHIYAAAKVHVLPSWRETPGLVNLEAGLARCNLVVSDRGTTREYFGDRVLYCEPGSVESIKKAIISAYAKEKTNDLAKYVEHSYTWEKAAEITKNAYSKILGGK